MKLKHSFVTLIDLFEALPFSITEGGDIEELMEATDRANEELFRFVESIEGNFAPVGYIGQDVIEDKFYQRFLFEGGGFMEVMQEAPLVIVGHFTHREMAEDFKGALEEALGEALDEEKMLNMLVEGIEIGEESGDVLSYKNWTKMKEIREAGK